MNTKDIQDMARLSGATDERGGKAETVFCFTEQELNNFSTLIVQDCINILRESGNEKSVDASFSIKEHFGVK